MIPYFLKSRQIIDACLASPSFQNEMTRITQLLCGAVRDDRLIMICGNGGSSSDADHFAAELLCRYKLNRPAIRATSLNHQGAITTAISNDFGYEHVFARQVEGLGRGGDILIVLSTSGKSPNILKALAQAKTQGITTVAFTGENTQSLESLCDFVLSVPSADTPLIQQIHLMAYHYMCDQIEQSMVSENQLSCQAV